MASKVYQLSEWSFLHSFVFIGSVCSCWQQNGGEKQSDFLLCWKSFAWLVFCLRCVSRLGGLFWCVAIDIIYELFIWASSAVLWFQRHLGPCHLSGADAASRASSFGQRLESCSSDVMWGLWRRRWSSTWSLVVWKVSGTLSLQQWQLPCSVETVIDETKALCSVFILFPLFDSIFWSVVRLS